MKNYEEMSHDVFERINEYEKEQKRKKRIATKTAAAICPALILMAAGVGIWKNGAIVPPDNNFTNDIVVELTTDVPTENSTKSAVTSAKPATTKPDSNANKTYEDTTNAVYADNEDIAEISGNDTVDVTADEAERPIEDDTPMVTDAPPLVKPPTDDLNNGICILISSLEYNGMTYFDFSVNISAYTRDAYIGKVSDFKGDYGDAPNYHVAPGDSVYTVKETNKVLFIVKENGTIVAMRTADLSEYHEPDYTAPDEQSHGDIPYEDAREYISGIIY